MAEACSPNTITSKLREAFKDAWKDQLNKSSKLSFYNSVKGEFGWEPYLDSDIISDFNERRSTAQIRCSSHKLKIETGRYSNTPQQERYCDFCHSTASNSTAIESEEHVFTHCPLGSDIRNHFKERVVSVAQELPGSSRDQALCLTFAGTFPSFLEEVTVKAGLQSSDIQKHFVRISCRHLHKIYRQTLQYKKDLQES